jgi:hypothetical protein
MTFTVNDMQELTRILTLHPEWRAEVRRLVLTDELLALPQTVQELVTAQQRTEQRVAELVVAQQRTEERLNQLAERTEARLQRLEASVAELVAAQQETEARLQRLEASVAELTRVVTVLSKTVDKMQARLSKVDGWQLERNYVDRAAGYFGNWLRRVRVVWPGELDEVLEERLETMLTTEERSEVLRLDAIIRGKVRQLTDQPEVYLAVEASLTIERNDVVRARRRATLLQRLGVRTIPVVTGETIEAAAEEDAAQNGVAVLQNGYSQGWERALATV